MPQTMPMYWSIMLIYSFILLILMTMYLYYLTMISSSYFINNKSLLNKYNYWNWKW